MQDGKVSMKFKEKVCKEKIEQRWQMREKYQKNVVKTWVSGIFLGGYLNLIFEIEKKKW